MRNLMNTVGRMDDVTEIFRTVLCLGAEFELHDTMSFPDVPNWDSMGHLNLVNELERRFAIILDVNDIEHISTVKDIRETIAKKKRKAQA